VELLSEFEQTFTTDGCWDKDERVKFGRQNNNK